MSDDTIIGDITARAGERMGKSVQAMVHEISGLRTGRASTALVDNITVECHGAQMTIKQVASVNVQDGATLVLSVWDGEMVQAVEKAIVDADIGLTPMVNGSAVHLNIPPLTNERRMELVKLVGKYGETAKVSVRNIRRDANQELKNALKDGDLTKDECRRGEEAINALTQKRVDEIGELLARKEKEITNV